MTLIPRNKKLLLRPLEAEEIETNILDAFISVNIATSKPLYEFYKIEAFSYDCVQQWTTNEVVLVANNLIEDIKIGKKEYFLIAEQHVLAVAKTN